MKSRFQKALWFSQHNIEAFIWISVILFLVISPVQSNTHFTICPLSLAGFGYCPGCGLGRSMNLVLHGQIAESLSMHPMGIFALSVFVARIISVFRNNEQFQKQFKSI